MFIQTSSEALLLKDWIQLVSWGVAIVGGLIAAFVAINQSRTNTKQRESELRWKQANLGRELVDEMFKTPAEKALLMVDYNDVGRTFDEIPEGEQSVFLADILVALDINKINSTARSIYIRECFEELFYTFERLEYFIQNNLLTFDDVSCPTEYYVEVMVGQKDTYLAFLKYAKYRRAILFLDRFPQWKEAQQLVEPERGITRLS